MKVRFADAGRQLRPATLAQLEARLGQCLPGRLLAKPTAGPNRRERVYSLPRIFWGWLWQMLNHNAPCREAVRQVQALSLLHGGPAVDADTGGCCRARTRLLQRLLAALKPGDVVLGDRGFGNFVILALLARTGVDLLARVPTNSRRVDFRRGQRLGRWDRIVVWHKGPQQGRWLSPSEWAVPPEQVTVRIVRLQVRQPGFRTRELTLVTTLLDAPLYPAAELLAAYARRWRLELCFDDLKTSLGLATLKCLSPALAEKELLAGLIAHNLLRCVMAEAAQTQAVPLDRISFKGALDALRQFNHALCQARGRRQREKLWGDLLQTLSRDLVPEQPGRREPRAVKRRPKYPLLTHSRHQQRDRPRRSVRKTCSNTKRLI